MGERRMSIVFSSQFDDLVEYNSSFDRGVLRVCYVGKNRNNSFISKETMERCIDSIYNCPIVCRYDRDSDMIGAHDVDVVSTKDGDLRLVNVTHPVGVIPESAKYWWEEIVEDSGAIHEYLCTDALLWKRQEAYEKIKRDGITDESMEINILDGHMQDGVYVIDRFEFTAFCLLGDAEPCFESASLTTFSRKDFKAQLDEMMREFKESIFQMRTSNEDGIYTENEPEGGEEKLDEKKNLMAQYGFVEDMLDFKLEDFSLEELTAKFEEMKTQNPEQPAGSEPDSDIGGDESQHFALAEQFREDLIGALSAEKVDTCFGEMSRYWYVDYDNEASEVYCYDQSDWNLYGFTYSMDGDNVVIDFASKKRMKFAIVAFDEGSQASPMASIFALVSEKYAENDSGWANKYQEAESKLDSMESEIGALRKFKQDIETEEAKQEREELFAQFTDLNGVEAFEELRESCDQYSMSDLEEKCFAIRGRAQSAKFSLSKSTEKTPKLHVMRHDDKPGDEPYGGIFVEYGVK